jgi:hypothetical protein
MRPATRSVSRSVLACSVAVALAACGETTHVSTSKAHRVTPPFRVTLTADSHHPVVGKRWHYEVRVTDAKGQPMRALVHLQILFGGAPVGQIGRHRVVGVWRETIGAPGNPPFPAQARGQPLVFQAVVTAKGRTVKRNWWIRVR